MNDDPGMTPHPAAASHELDVRAGWSGVPDIRGTGLDAWYRGDTTNVYPTKAGLSEKGIASILHGWLPTSAIIGRDTRVIGIGSCFASYFVMWLAENGFNAGSEQSPHNALLRYSAAFESPAVVAQQFRWAFGELDATSLQWMGKDKELFVATEERRDLVRRTLEQTDVLIVTLGLSEIWYDRATGEPLWRALTKRYFDPDRHVFQVETVESTRRWLEAIEHIRARHVPSMKIVFTVSPVPLKATFRPASAITANTASKAILRAALDEFLRTRPGQLNTDLFYYPSYEIVREYFRDPFDEDNRHVTPYVAAQVVRCFAEHFCDPSLRRANVDLPTGVDHLDRFMSVSRLAGSASDDTAQALKVADLERRIDELQRGFERRVDDSTAALRKEVHDLARVCDERAQLIEQLDSAARERLALIERLHAECARLREVANGSSAGPAGH